MFRSIKNISAQVVDTSGKVLCQANSLKLQITNKTEQAKEVGKKIADECIKLKVKRCIFDRGKYNYSGRVKILADSARNQGLTI